MIFRNSLFTATSLTAAINAADVAPQRLAELGIFEEDGVTTTSVVIERKEQSLVIAPAIARGADPTPMSNAKRSGISLEVPHVPVYDRLGADELQNTRAFGSEDELEGLESVRDDKLAFMDRTLSMTEEYHRLGAVQGLILNADGSVLFDLFDEFGVTEAAAIELDLTRAGWTEAAGGVLRQQFSAIKSQMRRILNNQPVKGVHSLCGEEIYEEIANHPEVRATYLATQEAKDLRGDTSETFSYGGILFEKYPGYGDVEIAADECRFIPVGVPGLFISRYAPANWLSAVNRKGLPRYAMATPDKTGEKYLELEAQMNGIHICTRPEVLIPGTIK